MVSPTLARMTAQVHITAFPMPKNLSESKLVLAALQKFGEVITYRNLKYDTTNTSPNPNRPIVAIFETADAADRAIAASPITIPLPTSTSPSKSQSSTSIPFTSTTKPPLNTRRSLIFEIQHSRHNHASALKRSPFYSTYNLFKNNPIYEDLISDETSIPLKELADTLSSKKYPIGAGVKSNIQEENRRMGATSLVNMWKEGMGIDVELENEGQDFGENGPVVEHLGGGIREPGEGLEDEKQSSVV
ncbi:hypothetical protein DTO006G1_3395 [Penicillium roqueforti]|uniref:uncharacterized protein n=1 Tax=Penicillium roqueforti TaxID=5082 RepID=UPI00190C46D5|nr:uncharacterized protein LCP9604111_6136 [Penicillium roqueforti]KAF9247437.1 hypothetical protein LCP9604111_6136 [Penicillium roqueforti]KAI1834777.1 hypothetical protein CBS147337_4331 [Penicillium roqueforti]KAI2676620.1 hypothetical protein CBS147355_5722 [Penicillium roqueforti]KAI2683495.1 hypothetical protein LCP963914a_5896 [Penicillium roqueforti]KAI2702935.1 hypothetical protein CBS147372_3250 [Penicillium roqueforti]